MSRNETPHCAWWHTPQDQSPATPLESIREAVEAMEAGNPIPMAAARVLVRALRAYLDGTERDITRALGLRPRRGGAAEVPARLERRQARDALIDRAFHSMSGKDTARADRLARLLAAPPCSTVITESDVFAYVDSLRSQHGGDLPSSGRQILRVVRGETITGRHENR